MRMFLVAAVFVLNAWTLARLYASPTSRRAKLAWTAAILLLPLLGAGLWLLRHAGSRGTPQSEP